MRAGRSCTLQSGTGSAARTRARTARSADAAAFSALEFLRAQQMLAPGLLGQSALAAPTAEEHIFPKYEDVAPRVPARRQIGILEMQLIVKVSGLASSWRTRLVTWCDAHQIDVVADFRAQFARASRQPCTKAACSFLNAACNSSLAHYVPPLSRPNNNEDDDTRLSKCCRSFVGIEEPGTISMHSTSIRAERPFLRRDCRSWPRPARPDRLYHVAICTWLPHCSLEDGGLCSGRLVCPPRLCLAG